MTHSSRSPLPAALSAEPALAILRGSSTAHVQSTVEVLVECGVRSLELTLTTPDALVALSALREWVPHDVAIGMGSVLTVEQARAARDAGASFLVTPSGTPEVIEYCVGLGLPVMPGALTPTEVVVAWNSGASAVKLFPASLGGISYMKDVLAPLPHIPLIPTGGVALDSVAEWLAAGARAVGLGSPLVGDALEGGSVAELRERAQRLVDSLPRRLGS